MYIDINVFDFLEILEDVDVQSQGESKKSDAVLVGKLFYHLKKGCLFFSFMLILYVCIPQWYID